MASIFDNVVLIPSLHPDALLREYVEKLIETGFHRILVVDDGSGSDPKYQDIFRAIDAYPACSVIGYAVNRGKGHALKHGMSYIKEHFPDAPGVITADSDGQHSVEDVQKIALALESQKHTLVLGSRDFNQASIPFRSRFGNKSTSFFYRILYGSRLPDTQTGLRGFASNMLDFLISIPGNRFEYEMNMLVYCSVNKIPFAIVPIDTIYIEENKSSHFRPLQDSMRIYRILFGNFFKYLLSSLSCFLVDIVIFTVLNLSVLPLFFSLDPNLQRYISAFIARLLSAGLNFLINKNIVFTLSGNKHAVYRYALLSVANYYISTTILNAFVDVASMYDTSFKIVIDTLLYFANYRIQQAWVFNNKRRRKQHEDSK